MRSIGARTVLRSRNAARPSAVVSTLLVQMPRMILAEFNTHRVFSRNAASTRAIPTEKLIEQVKTDPFIPLVWGRNQRGMQAGEEVEDTAVCRERWLESAAAAVHQAERLLELGLHKQIVGRVLEPYMWTIVCVSSTEWDNFLLLRDHPDAEPHIQVLAREIRTCLEREDDIQTLQPGEWHLPFTPKRWPAEHPIDRADAIKFSVACCASTSYKTVDGFDMTFERAIALHDKLVSSRPIHASPAEHVCVADDVVCVKGTLNQLLPDWAHSHQHGNFVGFRQYRHMLGEMA